jgi:hypothetical protein
VHPCGGRPLLELLDLASVKINKPKPRQLSLIRCRLQSTNVAIAGIHSSAATRFGDVAGVAALGRPRLMIFLTVVPQSRPHPFGEGGQAVAMPLLQRLTGERQTGAVALIGENSDLVHHVTMLRPARRDDIGDIPDVLLVQPGDDSLQPRPNLLSQLRRLAGAEVPRPRHIRQISQRQQVILLPAGCEIKLSIGRYAWSGSFKPDVSPAGLTVPCMHWTSFRTDDGVRYSVLLEDDTEVDLVQAADRWKLSYCRSADEDWAVVDLGGFNNEGELLIAADDRLAELLKWPELAQETTLLRRQTRQVSSAGDSS